MDEKTLNYFNNLQEILGAFEPLELTTAHVLMNTQQKRNRHGASSNLLEVLIENPNSSPADVMKLLGTNKTEQAFYKSLSRLKEKLLESLVADDSINRNNKYSAVFTLRVNCRKKITLAYVLFSKGLEVEGRKLLEFVVIRAKQYELYDELYEVIHWIRNEDGLRYGVKKYEKYADDLRSYAKCRDAVYSARDLYYNYYILSDREGASIKKVKRIEEILETLKVLIDTTEASLVKYYYFLLLSEYYSLTKKRSRVDALAEDLIELLKSTPALRKELWFGVAHSDIADMMLSCGELDKTLIYCKSAKAHFEEGGYNYLVVEGIKFRALFHLRKYEEAKSVLAKLEYSDVEQKFPLIKSKYTYFSACISFRQGEFKKSISLLADLPLLKKDKEGWNICIRILLVMNYLELNELDVSESQIVSFRKYMKRMECRSDVDLRFCQIVQLLLELAKDSFQYKQVFQRNKAVFSDLESIREKSMWDEKSPELIPFHSWFMEKVNN